MKSIQIHGQPASEQSSRVCVLYDPKDGRVIHVHGATTLPGGREVSEAEMEERARTHAKALGRPVEGLKHLHLPVAAIQQGGPLRVNPEGTGLVAEAHRPSTREVLAQYRRLRDQRR